jgi:hypothetical protein
VVSIFSPRGNENLIFSPTTAKNRAIPATPIAYLQ